MMFLGAPDDLVGIPYRPGGRSVDGADCWGTVWLYYARHGIDLPSYDGPTIPVDHHALAAARRGDSPWRPVSEPRVGDLGLWKRQSGELHAGVMVAPGMVLHNDSNPRRPRQRGSVIQRVEDVGDAPEWWRYVP